MDVFDFIEGWYNQHRRHSGLDYKSPISCENAAPSSGMRRKPYAVQETGTPPIWFHEAH
jgi:transposase InsO family protein